MHSAAFETAKKHGGSDWAHRPLCSGRRTCHVIFPPWRARADAPANPTLAWPRVLCKAVVAATLHCCSLGIARRLFPARPPCCVRPLQWPRALIYVVHCFTSTVALSLPCTVIERPLPLLCSALHCLSWLGRFNAPRASDSV